MAYRESDVQRTGQGQRWSEGVDGLAVSQVAATEV
jgi:hypothetical protein